MIHALLLAGAVAGWSVQEGAAAPASVRPAPAPLAAADSVFRGSAGQLTVPAVRVESPQIRLDGSLDEPAWQHAALLTGFSHYEPVEGTPALDDTEVYVFYSSDALYFGIRVHDSAPDQIRARLGERDRAMMSDDWVRIMLDTFNDRRQAYVFYVTPLGIQADGLWLEGGERRGGSSVPIDFNPDFIWQSEARLNEAGWTAEIRIPYISLRFRTEPVQSWGINVARETRRNGFKSSWAPLTQNRSSTLAQIGTLAGLAELKPARLIELNPVATGGRSGRRTTAGVWERPSPARELGLNLRVGLTQNLVADATLNPDFSHVEADAGQITANQRFALSFPEKRPFFLEGTEIFQTPQRLVHTRSIVSPAGGAKLTGKLGALNVAYLGALDESGEGGNAAVHLVRLRGDVGAGSTVGALFTDRSLVEGADFNRVVGTDLRLLFRGRYTLSAQLARSWTRSADPAGADRDGNLRYLALDRSGRTLGLQLLMEDVAPDFHAGSGFINRTGDTRLFGTTQLNLYNPTGALLERWGADLRVEGFYRHEDFGFGAAPIETEIELQPNLFLRGGNTLRFILRRGAYALDADDYARFRVRAPDGALVPMAAPAPLDDLYAFAFMPSLRPAAWLQLGGRMYLREVPIFAEGSRGFEFFLNPDVKLWPSEGLSLELSFARSRLWRQSDDVLFSVQDIPRLKAQYQLSRSLFARAVAQYNLQRREPLHDPATGSLLHVEGAASRASERGEFGGQLLVSYEHSPGTLFYVGWSQQLRGANSSWRVQDMARTSDGVFVKFSYLWRR